MNWREMYFKQTSWSGKELIRILIIVLVAVPFLIEFQLKKVLLEWFQNDLYSGTLIGFIMSIIFMVAIYLIALKPKQLSWNQVGVNPFHKRYWGPIVGWTIALVVGSIGLLIIMSLLGVGSENSKTESIRTQMTVMHIIIAWVSAGVISPIYEEILYRGFLYRWFRSKYGVRTGMIISSFIFMIVHIPTYNVLPVTFISGLLFAWTYERTKSVVPSMIIHSVFNTIALIATVIG